MNLFELQSGKKCLIDKITITGSMRRRLLDLGLAPNTKVECVGKSPLGDPKAFLIRGAVIALREETCQKIFIKDVI